MASDGTVAAVWAEPGGSVVVPAGANYAYVELLDQMTTGWIAFDDVSLSCHFSPYNVPVIFT